MGSAADGRAGSGEERRLVGAESLGTPACISLSGSESKRLSKRRRGLFRFPGVVRCGRDPALNRKRRSGAAPSSPPPEFGLPCFGVEMDPRGERAGLRSGPPRPGRKGLRRRSPRRPAAGESGPPARNRARSAPGGIPAGVGAMARGPGPLPALGPAGLGRQGASPEAGFLQAPPLAAAKPPCSQAGRAFVRRSLRRRCEGFSLGGEIGGRAPAQITCHPAQRETYTPGIPEGE